VHVQDTGWLVSFVEIIYSVWSSILLIFYALMYFEHGPWTKGNFPVVLEIVQNMSLYR
jgi:hypothetical protein